MALMLFLICNPIGGVPTFVALVKDFDFRRQRWILFREAVFSALLAYFFLFLGETFLHTINIELYAVRIGGGILVFLVSLNMIFPVHQESQKGSNALQNEPFIVPIATPLLTGGGVFSTIMVLADQASVGMVGAAIFIAWAATIAIVVSSVYLNKLLGKRGLLALEQLMGMLLAMLAIEIFSLGLHAFIKQSM